MLAASIATESVGVMTALAGLVGAGAAAVKLLRPSAPEPAPEKRPEDEHRFDHVSHEHDPGDVAVIADLRAALGESRSTVHALRRRLDQATGVQTEGAGKDWLSG